MTRTKIDLSPERKLITYLITSKKFAQEIIPLLSARALKTRYAQIVAEWVSEYYAHYSDVPGKLIQDVYLEKKRSLRDEDEQESVAEFLQNLSNDTDTTDNPDFYIEQAIAYLKTRSMEQTVEAVQTALATGDVTAAEGAIANYKRVGRPEGDGYSIIDKPGDIISAFMDEEEVVLTFPKAVGKVVGPCRRGDLISFIAPMKRGKTHALVYSAEVGMSQGKQCAFITLEMPKPQIIRRAWQSITGSPKLSQTVRIPYYVPDKEPTEEVTEDTKYRVEYKNIAKEGVNLSNIEEMQERIRRLYRGGDCRFIPMPSKSTTIKDIETVLDNLRFYNNYDVDILIIDYADLLGAKAGEYRHQLDDIWSNLKRVAQERNILIITATQTNRGGLDGSDIDTTNVAEDIRKLGHVSKLIALNQTVKEKGEQIMRWRILLDRDEQHVFEDACTLQCLSTGKFVLDSKLRTEVL